MTTAAGRETPAAPRSPATEPSRRVFGSSAWIPQYRDVEVVRNGASEGTYQLVGHVRIADNRIDIKSLDETVDKSSPKTRVHQEVRLGLRRADLQEPLRQPAVLLRDVHRRRLRRLVARRRDHEEHQRGAVPQLVPGQGPWRRAQRQVKQTRINKLFKNKAFEAPVTVRYAAVAPTLKSNTA